MNKKTKIKPGDVVRPKRKLILQGIMCHAGGKPTITIEKNQTFQVMEGCGLEKENEIVIYVPNCGGYTVNTNDLEKIR